MYGLLTILFVLEHYEAEEEYEECKKIIDVIKEQQEFLGTTLSTTLNNATIKEVVDAYKDFNLTGVNAVSNSKYYASLVINDNDKLKK